MKGLLSQDILKQHPEINAGCNLKFVGEPLLNIQAGWMATGRQFCIHVITMEHRRGFCSSSRPAP